TGNDLRISFDKHLRAVPFPQIEELYDERDIRYPMDGHFILEVKFNHFCPAWVRPILANLELIKTPASKYVMCIDSQPRILKDRKYSHFYMYQRRTTSIQSSVSSAQNKPELC
ncbi:MAG: VTC domain-containing protein, partial [Saprospiraceae bacterium]|nr:VTC domain-containing protein [Saprospiraceae bacterium]